LTYIGQQPATTFDSGIQDRFTGLTTNTVTLNHEISAEEDILVVWNNIVQDKNTYSVGGTGNKTVTLGGTLVSADVVTVYYLNKVMQSISPTAGSISSTTLGNDILSGQTDIGADIVDADLFLVDDGAGGTVRKTAASRLKTYIGSGLSAASQWRLTTTFAGDAAPIASNWEQSDSTAYANLGSAMNESSGIFQFPSSGFWFVRFTAMIKTDNAANRAAYNIFATTNNSSYSQITEAQVFGANTGGANTYASVSSEAIVDVTDTAQVKVRFDVAQEDNSNDTMGSSSYPQTGATFIRLGDT
jgi:hypothetical protein